MATNSYLSLESIFSMNDHAKMRPLDKVIDREEGDHGVILKITPIMVIIFWSSLNAKAGTLLDDARESFLDGSWQLIPHDVGITNTRDDLSEAIVLLECKCLILNEYVVPMGFSLDRWKAYKKKHKISNAEYHKDNPGKKWKVIHGHKKGEVGQPLPGLSNVSYNKANSAHSAIVMN